jgi:hypothetical protein
MLQRIQSLYLLVAMVSVLLLLFIPVAEVLDTDNQLFKIRIIGTFRITPDGAQLLSNYWWSLLVLMAVILFLVVTAIFLYRKRILQMRFCILTILLSAGLIGLLFYHISYVFRNMSIMEHSYRITLVMPLVIIISAGLAFRAIQKDEELVRSIDRIR